MTTGRAWPRQLLDAAAWDFADQERFPTLAAFEAAVLAYERATAADAPADAQPWEPQRLALQANRVVLRYYADPEVGQPGYHDALLEAPSERGFTEVDLLFRVHNAVVPLLSTAGHHWFEGLDFEGVADDGTPIYGLIGGS